MKTFGWYKKIHDEVMNDPELKARYDEYVAELIDEEKMITNLKRLLFEADADYALTDECNNHERANESRRLLNEINEALKEEKGEL